MKLKVGDKVLVTGGKDKGRESVIVQVIPSQNRVVVEGANLYVKHVKARGDQAGQKMTLPRPLPTAKVAVINDKGQRDRVGYQVAKDGQKQRIFKKTGAVIPDNSKKSAK